VRVCAQYARDLWIRSKLCMNDADKYRELAISPREYPLSLRIRAACALAAVMPWNLVCLVVVTGMPGPSLGVELTAKDVREALADLAGA
jgi:hypothetical protein